MLEYLTISNVNDINCLRILYLFNLQKQNCKYFVFVQNLLSFRKEVRYYSIYTYFRKS